jgi:hypothetical protein
VNAFCETAFFHVLLAFSADDCTVAVRVAAPGTAPLVVVRIFLLIVAQSSYRLNIQKTQETKH